MTREELTELVMEERTFVITTHDGFAIAIGPEAQQHLIIGKRILVTLNAQGDIIHIPYQSIAYIQKTVNDMSHCQICLCPSPHHAVNCPVATGEPVAGSLSWQQGQLGQNDPTMLERIEWLEKEVTLLR